MWIREVYALAPCVLAAAGSGGSTRVDGGARRSNEAVSLWGRGAGPGTALDELGQGISCAVERDHDAAPSPCRARKTAQLSRHPSRDAREQ